MNPRSIFLLSVIMIVILVAGCWADFPDSRFNLDGAPPADTVGKDVALQDGPVTPPDGRPDTRTDGTPPDTMLPGDLKPPTDYKPPEDTQPPPDTVVQPDLGNCPTACVNGCNNNVCELSCATGCTCPPGWDCTVDCPKSGCQGPIDCSSGKACTITCGDSACSGAINCGLGLCTITCANKACTGQISCATSCGCSVDCKTGSSCTGAVICPSVCSNACGPNDGCDNCTP